VANASIFYIANIFFGISQSLGAVTMAPFLMENSGEKERTYLFSIGSGLQMTAASIGNWVGGFLPTWVALRSVEATSSTAYGGALAVTAVNGGLWLASFDLPAHSPHFHLRPHHLCPIGYAAQHPA
jgi:MFS family permease